MGFASKLIPPHPANVTVIRDVSPRIAVASAPFLRFGLMKVGGRCTIVRMTSGGLFVFSPVALTPELRSKVESMGGDVRYITAPDIEHHIFIGEWNKAFPKARVLGVEGLPEKREKTPETAGTHFSAVWTKANKADLAIEGGDDADFRRDFDVEFVDAHSNKELVVNFRPERTLIQADLIFNLPATEQYSRTGESATAGVFTKLFNGLMNTRGQATAQRRFIWYAASSGDRKGFAESMRRIDGWDFDRIIPCHGDVIESGGKRVFQTVMAWHLQGKGK